MTASLWAGQQSVPAPAANPPASEFNSVEQEYTGSMGG